ncbi:MAG: hypothetical protein ABI629_25945 [bacterium]
MSAALIASCGGFLVAVLWFDLMFDVQVLPHRKHAELPEPVLASIAAYYRRVTTDANPMGYLVGLVMIAGLAALIGQLIAGEVPRWRTLASLLLLGGGAGLAGRRIFSNAIRLGTRRDTTADQSALARSICRDHFVCFVGLATFVVLQLGAAD